MVICLEGYEFERGGLALNGSNIVVGFVQSQC